MIPTVSLAVLHTLGVIMILTAVFSLMFNGCGLLVFLKSKSLRSPSNWFIMSLCVCDLFMAFASVIPAVACFHHDFLLQHNLCVFEGFFMYFLGLTSMYLLAAISLVRYIIIAKPLLKSRITYRVASAMIAGCMGFGFLWSSFPLMGWNHYTREGAGVSCSVLWQSDDIADTSYIIAIFIACLLFPVAVMGYSYFHVYLTIRHIRKNSTLDSCNRVKMRNFQLEQKMLKTCIIMVSVFLLSWLPYSVTSLTSASGFPHLISPLMGTIPAMIAKMSGLWNPIIYIATNKQFRSAFYKLLPYAVNWSGQPGAGCRTGDPSNIAERQARNKSYCFFQTEFPIGTEW
ncbi:parapinopsin-like [Haliotis asinina]|uniref:parapinopsin-like n=1 Tax=Haliotis asinina TaxID=109174 RepID=UPI00353180EB